MAVESKKGNNVKEGVNRGKAMKIIPEVRNPTPKKRRPKTRCH